jgi:hypothetical protein
MNYVLLFNFVRGSVFDNFQVLRQPDLNPSHRIKIAQNSIIVLEKTGSRKYSLDTL